MATTVKRDLGATRRALQSWMADRIGLHDLSVGELAVPSQGFSSETLLFDATWRDETEAHTQHLVARVEATTHLIAPDPSIAAQWSTMEAAASGVPVPDLLWLEEDPSVLGAPFLVMRRVDGPIPSDIPSYHMHGWMHDRLGPIERERAWDNAIAILGRIHQIPAGQVKHLGDRQQGDDVTSLVAWLERWYLQSRRDRPQPVADKALERVRSAIDYPHPGTLLWGDARLGNLVFNDACEVAAVLDWEAAAVGPPEADLAWWLFQDAHSAALSGVPRLEGLPGADDTIKRYEEARGRAVEHLDFFLVLAGLQMATVYLRFADLQRDAGTLPPGTTLGWENPATQLLADLLGLPRPPLAPELEAAKAAATQGTADRA